MDQVLAYLAALGDWTWWILAALLLLLELLAPGVFFLWLAIAAAVVGLSTLLFDWTWQWEVASFAVLSLVALVLSRMFLVRRPIGTDRPLLNRRGQQLVGREFVLGEPIRDGQGRVKVDDSIWRAVGPDIEAGARVRVREVRDAVLVVEPAEVRFGAAPRADGPAAAGDPRP